MFGINKRQAEREQSLEQQKILNQAVTDKYNRKLSRITEKMDQVWKETEDGLAAIEDSQNELDRQLTQVIDAVNKAEDSTKSQREQYKTLCRRMRETAQNPPKDQEEPAEDDFKEQQQRVQELIDQSGSLGSASAIVAKNEQEFCKKTESMQQNIENMADLGRQMGVRSLNAAIEAGRMGESGKQFMEAAEEVRGLAVQYQQQADALSEEIKDLSQSWEAAREQMQEQEKAQKDCMAHLKRAAREFFGNVDGILRRQESAVLKEAFLELAEEFENALEEGQPDEQYHMASQAMGQAGESFIKQQEIVKNLREKKEETKQWFQKTEQEWKDGQEGSSQDEKE